MPAPLRARRRLRRRGLVAVSVATGVVLATGTLAAATTTTTTAATDLATAIAAPGVSVTGASLRVPYPCTAGDCPTAVSTTPLAGFPDNGSSYAILTNGNAAYAEQPNSEGSTGQDWGVDDATGIGASVHDDQVYAVNLGPAGGNCLALDFRFLSDEYPEYVGAGYNDAFFAQLNSWSVTADPATQTVSAPGNFAAGAGDQISIDGAGPSSMADTVGSGLGTTYDGATALLTARTPVTPGSSNTLYLTLFDQGDGVLDSAVLLDNLRFENAKPGQCKSLSLDPYDGGTGVTQTSGTKVTLAKGKSSLSVPLDCTLPTGPVSCSVSGSATFKASKAGQAGPAGRAVVDRAAGRGTPIASGAVTLAPDASGTLVLQTTRKGRKVLQTAATKPRQLRKQAAKLLARASHSHGAQATALRARAATLKQQAAHLAGKPLGTVTVTLVNPANGATSVIMAKLKR